MPRSIAALIVMVTMLAGAPASAGTVTPTTSLVWTPDEISGAIDEQLVFTLMGVGFTEGTSGGDFAISFDESLLEYVSFVVNAAVFQTSFVDDSAASAGLIGRVDVFHSGDLVTNSFHIGTLTMKVIAGLASVDSDTLRVVAAPLPLGVGWSRPNPTSPNGIEPIGVDYNPVIAPIPAPPALWLLLTAVGALAARRLRRA